MAKCRAMRLINRSCNIKVDYSRETGDKILPFTVELDLANSIFSPKPGENQRFSYKIKGVGENTSTHTDLTSIMFGVCDQIKSGQLANIRVVRNGIAEEVLLGDNVEMKADGSLDPYAECTGLKFNFALDQAAGEMEVSFDLTKIYPLGATRVSLSGEGADADGLYICGPAGEEEETCPSVGYQTVNVSVPVTVTPYASVGATSAYPCGLPVIIPGTDEDAKEKSESYTFTIAQKLCVMVPVEFGVRAGVGRHSVECVHMPLEEHDVVCEDP